jgi:hypothetical protein
MVKGSDKTYGQLMVEAASLMDRQEVGETNESLMKQFKAIIEEAVQKNFEKGVKGTYYIHIWVTKEPYANNTLHIYPQCRRTRPSPYQGNDHYLWSVQDGGKVQFEWCIPSKEVLGYILSNPNEFDADYISMLRNYCKDKIDKENHYLVDGKVQ